MARINENYLKLQAGYLFPEISRRVNAFTQANPDAAKQMIRCGIGDVTEPLPSNSLLDSGPKGLLRHVEQESDVLGDISDRHRERRVAMPPLVDRTRIDTDDVAIFEDVVAWDSVDDRRVR